MGPSNKIGTIGQRWKNQIVGRNLSLFFADQGFFSFFPFGTKNSFNFFFFLGT
jgi:hypothetical protein